MEKEVCLCSFNISGFSIRGKGIPSGCPVLKECSLKLLKWASLRCSNSQLVCLWLLCNCCWHSLELGLQRIVTPDPNGVGSDATTSSCTCKASSPGALLQWSCVLMGVAGVT